MAALHRRLVPGTLRQLPASFLAFSAPTSACHRLLCSHGAPAAVSSWGQRGSVLGTAPGGEAHVWLLWLGVIQGRSLPELGPRGSHQPLLVPAAGFRLCSAQGRHLLRPLLSANKPSSCSRCAGRWSLAMALSLLHNRSLCSGASRGPQGAGAEQTLPNTAEMSAGQAGACRPLTEIPSQPGGAKRALVLVAPSSNPDPCREHLPRLHFSSSGIQEEPLAGSPWALLGLQTGGGSTRPHWEWSPPWGLLPSCRSGALQRQPRRRQRLFSNQTDPYLGSS